VSAPKGLKILPSDVSRLLERCSADRTTFLKSFAGAERYDEVALRNPDKNGADKPVR
jgi:hypothetical protein